MDLKNQIPLSLLLNSLIWIRIFYKSKPKVLYRCSTVLSLRINMMTYVQSEADTYWFVE